MMIAALHAGFLSFGVPQICVSGLPMIFASFPAKSTAFNTVWIAAIRARSLSSDRMTVQGAVLVWLRFSVSSIAVEYSSHLASPSMSI
jgi:hypothetical protein